jgi:EAL domain-containing protein (putative c-di-GMP-specific phosphodiesterase class I)
LIVNDLLTSHGLAAHHLTLEVTETAAMGSAGTNLETLVALRKLGVCISIDDYGTGLSTLEYLKKIPATEIKIDQSFVTAVTRSHSDRLMVHSTIQLVHSLGHVVVAEGVETHATLDALRSMGCDFAQGFLIGRPVTLDAIANSLGTSFAPKRARHG